MGFPGGSDSKESATGDPGSIPGSGRSPGEGNGYPLQYSCLENSVNRGAWQATVLGVKSQTQLSYFHCHRLNFVHAYYLIQSSHFMANRWGNIDFTFLGSKITADGDCSHEIKRCLLLGRKAMTNLDSILKSRDITLPRKVCLVRAMVFP